MGIVPVGGFVFHVSGRNCNTPCLFFGRFIDFVKLHKRGKFVTISEGLGDGCGKGRFSMVNVPNSANIYVGFIPLEFSFTHCVIPPKS
jgi:hypothetical protein